MKDYIAECEIIKDFLIDGEVTGIAPYGEGHINSTFLVQTTKKKYILQRINTIVFKKPENVMENIMMVTEFIRKKGALTLNVIKTADGEMMNVTDGGVYRVYDFIDDSVTLQRAESSEVFENAGYSFGEFQKLLADFDAGRLHEIIENFHDTPTRFENFRKAVAENIAGRLDSCRGETDFVLARKDTFSVISDGLRDKTIPLRVTHNDTKLNNILMDGKTKRGKAVIDLDTVMPGSMLYDFGDAIRFGASTAAEDETDLSKVHFDLELFRAYAKGFCGALGGSMSMRERELLPYSAYLMTMECGMRFLTDYLEGDVYFSTKYPGHNLVRSRTQFKLAYEMEQQMDAMKDIINEILH